MGAEIPSDECKEGEEQELKSSNAIDEKVEESNDSKDTDEGGHKQKNIDNAEKNSQSCDEGVSLVIADSVNNILDTASAVIDVVKDVIIDKNEKTETSPEVPDKSEDLETKEVKADNDIDVDSKEESVSKDISIKPENDEMNRGDDKMDGEDKVCADISSKVEINDNVCKDEPSEKELISEASAEREKNVEGSKSGEELLEVAPDVSDAKSNEDTQE